MCHEDLIIEETHTQNAQILVIDLRKFDGNFLTMTVGQQGASLTPRLLPACNIEKLRSAWSGAYMHAAVADAEYLKTVGGGYECV